MLVIEGPDLVGKTTLAKALIESIEMRSRVRPEYQHFGRLPENWDYCRDYVKKVRQWCVTDRWWESEIAYGEAIRGHACISPRQEKIVEGATRAAGGLTILVMPAGLHNYEQLLEEQWTTREMFNQEQLRRVCMRYMSKAFAHDFMIEVDYRGKNKTVWPAEMHNKVAQIASEYHARQMLIA